ncbi:MAG: hypothetical protein H7Y88_03425 [Phycisphaerales bacterium]|nr:hypothetical protein [Phycisphaerales bacterium]
MSESIRASLTRFAGDDGFASLLRRALVLASAEVPSLRSVRVEHGTLQGFEPIAAEAGAGRGMAGGAWESEAAVAVTANLLELLVTFIGEPLTLTLVRAAWPDTSLDGLHSRTEADS